MSTDVVRSGDLVENQFNIAQTPEAFEILSDGLYTDSIRAVVRELGTNALDAHADAGTLETPVDLHMPSWSEPFYSIRDYGTGMSPDTIRREYITYFSSTKRGDAATTGKFGLGCKSPFAYVRAFTVTSYWQGEKFVFSCFIAEGTDDVYDDDGELVTKGEPGGFPRCIYLGESDDKGNPIGVPTDEPSGLEVRFDVESSDFHRFSDKVQQVYKWFREDRRPNFTGRDITIHDVEYMDEYTGKDPKAPWAVVQGELTHQQPKVLMGNIIYPFSISDEDVPKDKPLTRWERAILTCGVVFKFNVDVVDITPSREALKMTPRTVSRLRKRMRQMKDELSKMLSEEFSGCKSLWEAKCKYRELYGMGSQSKSVQMAGLNELKWRGHDLDGYTATWGHGKGITAWRFGMERGRWSSKLRDYTHKATRRSVESIDAHPELMILEDDLPRGSFTRINRGVETGNIKGAVLLVSFENDEARQTFIKALGINADQIGKTSALPRYPNGNGVETKRQVVRIYELLDNDHHERDLKHHWSPAEVDIDDKNSGGFYVAMDRWDCEDGRPDRPHSVGAYMVKQYVIHLRKLGLKIPKITGFRRPVYKKVRENKNWVEFFTWAQKQVDKMVKEAGQPLLTALANRHIPNDRTWGYLETLNKAYLKNHKVVVPGPYSPVSLTSYEKLILAMQGVEGSLKYKNLDSWAVVHKAFRFSLDDGESITLNLDLMVDQVQRDYPLFNLETLMRRGDWEKRKLRKAILNYLAERA